MIPYINQSDLIQLGYDITSADTAAVAQICQTATALIESRTLRKFYYSTSMEKHQVYSKGGVIRLFTKNYPVVSVSSAVLYWSNYPQSTMDLTPSVFIDNDMAYVELNLGGGGILPINPVGKMIVSITYAHGWPQTEIHTVPATAPYTVTVDNSYEWIESISVTGATPTTISEGVYTFASVDAGVTVTFEYATIPGDLKQAGALIAQEYLDNYFSAKQTGFANVTSIKDGNRTLGLGNGSTNANSSKLAGGVVSDAAMDILIQYRRVR